MKLPIYFSIGIYYADAGVHPSRRMRVPLRIVSNEITAGSRRGAAGSCVVRHLPGRHRVASRKILPRRGGRADYPKAGRWGQAAWQAVLLCPSHRQRMARYPGCGRHRDDSLAPEPMWGRTPGDTWPCAAMCRAGLAGGRWLTSRSVKAGTCLLRIARGEGSRHNVKQRLLRLAASGFRTRTTGASYIITTKKQIAHPWHQALA